MLESAEDREEINDGTEKLKLCFVKTLFRDASDIFFENVICNAPK